MISRTGGSIAYALIALLAFQFYLGYLNAKYPDERVSNGFFAVLKGALWPLMIAIEIVAFVAGIGRSAGKWARDHK